MLWVAIKALERLCSPERPLHVVIYTGDVEATPQEILDRARVCQRVCICSCSSLAAVTCLVLVHRVLLLPQQRFHVDLLSSPVQVRFQYVTTRFLMAADRYAVNACYVLVAR